MVNWSATRCPPLHYCQTTGSTIISTGTDEEGSQSVTASSSSSYYYSREEDSASLATFLTKEEEDDDKKESPSCDSGHQDCAAAALLSWRLDPVYSFSDWRIRVHSKNNNSTRAAADVYHVHRTVLAFGPRRSGYFSHLFHYAIGNESPVTTLELDDQAAAVFGDFLDYVYDSKAFLIQTTNAVALSFLAQCFMVPQLQRDVDTFIRSDLSLSNVATYMSQAIHFQDSTTSCRVIDKCVEEAVHAFVGAAEKVSPGRSVLEAEERCKPIWKFLTRFPQQVIGSVRRRKGFSTQP